jgi:regulator of protease activity HflC (stomatin/prohibitin superfamily)
MLLSRYKCEEIHDQIYEIFPMDWVGKLNGIDKATESKVGSEGVQLEALNALVKDFGVEIDELDIYDISYPKYLQAAFTKNVAAKIQAQTELEKARANVATARTLKNAADLIRDNENIKFVQMLEVLSKAVETGKHQFVIGTNEILAK